LALYVHTYELAPNPAAVAARKVWRRRQPNFGQHGSARQPDLVRASRKTDGGAAEGSIEDFQKRLGTTGSIERAPGSGRLRTTCTTENVDAVGDLA